jgi:hypothetical protein
MTMTRVLVLVKAAPQPSRRYGDTVCVAGVNMDTPVPSWIRLYPVPFRYLEGARQFKKYDVITVRTRDAGSDKRPESRKIDAESIDIGIHLKGWKERSPWVEPLAGPPMCRLIDNVKSDINEASLGAVRVTGEPRIRFSEHPGWSAEQLNRFNAYRNQGDLFQETPPTLLDAPSFIVHLDYSCEAPACGRHLQKIIDWELTALQFRYRRRPDADLKAAVIRNFLEIPFSQERRPMLLVGNQENVQRRASFTVLGLYYPKWSDIEQSGLLF